MDTIKSVCYGSLLAAALVMPTVAQAVPIDDNPFATFALTSDHCTGGCLTDQTSGGTVTVTDLGSGSLMFDISLANGNEFVSTGAGDAFAFNLDGNPTITFSDVSTGFTPLANPQSAQTLHEDGTGDFEYALTCSGCGSGGSAPLTGPLDFTISATGLTLASLEQNSDGQFFEVDVISGTTRNTGLLDASEQTGGGGGGGGGSAPEPASLLLLGAGMLGLGLMRRRLVR